MRRPALWLAATLALPGCALLVKSTPTSPRYFSPQDAAPAAAGSVRPDLLLRLGRVSGWSHLRERMVLRTAGNEVLFRDDVRWTERPEVYLRRALERALFEERGIVEARSGGAASLDVELVAFEEVEAPHLGRLQARVTLRGPTARLLEETLTVEEPVRGAGHPPDVVAALSAALDAGVARIADRVVLALASAPGATAPAPHP